MNVERAVCRLFRDAKRLKRLLRLEKRRRGVPAGSLVFVGMHNVAQHWWCTRQAVLKSRAEELTFFSAYLEDRIRRALQLGRINKLPRSDAAVLNIGCDISLENVEKLEREHRKVRRGLPTDTDICLASVDVEDDDGRRRRILNPDLPRAEKALLTRDAEQRKIGLLSIEAIPLLRGVVFHSTRAEKYPSFRWAFPWRKFTIVGVPDGLTRSQVYEFKSTRSRYLLSFVKPVALAQADLYGYFFERPRKRVQVHIKEEAKIETYAEPVNAARAEETLAAFAAVDGGERAALPPKPWKCRICDFRAACPIAHPKRKALSPDHGRRSGTSRRIAATTRLR